MIKLKSIIIDVFPLLMVPGILLLWAILLLSIASIMYDDSPKESQEAHIREERTRNMVDQFSKETLYFRDTTTGICFAQVSLNTRFAFTEVSCNQLFSVKIHDFNSERKK